MAKTKSGVVHTPLIQISKRSDVSAKKAWLVRIGTGVLALLVCGAVSAILSGKSYFSFFESLFVGAFGTSRRIWNLLHSTAVLLCISLAVTPAFKMRFWNIGAEGQALIGALASVACIVEQGGKIPEWLLLCLMIVASIAAGAIWAVIPAVFKALWGTNETLFTLMMNYIAIGLVACCITAWQPNGSAVLGILNYGHLPVLAGQSHLLTILVVAVVTALMFVYLRFSKHGYELTVVGESENTAKYIGIDVKKVIIRTMLLSGAICGLTGLLLVGGTDHTITTATIGGRGFTAILVSWLSKFDPLTMSLTALIVSFLDQGAAQAQTSYRLGEAFPEIITGLFFFFIIGCEFFVNYKLKVRLPEKKQVAKEDNK